MLLRFDSRLLKILFYFCFTFMYYNYDNLKYCTGFRKYNWLSSIFDRSELFIEFYSIFDRIFVYKQN